MKEKSVKIAS